MIVQKFALFRKNDQALYLNAFGVEIAYPLESGCVVVAAISSASQVVTLRWICLFSRQACL